MTRLSWQAQAAYIKSAKSLAIYINGDIGMSEEAKPEVGMSLHVCIRSFRNLVTSMCLFWDSSYFRSYLK